VPLSAGLDSRFIASGLAAAGYAKVHCVAYGRAGNREAVTSRTIAQRLGYRWSFVPYTTATVRAAWATADHRAYEAYADSLTSIPFPQDYLALTALRARGELPPGTVVVNGQTGDFITGNHVSRALAGNASGSDAARLTRILDALVAKHFKHWSGLATPERLARIRALLTAEIAAVGGLPADPGRDHGVYEYSEFVDRQTKYVINGQRLYEYFGLDWRLPLWDRPYLDFWARAPRDAKVGQALYRRVLLRDDWGGVWRDIPINPTRIRPLSLLVARQIAKLLHAPLGAARWRAFERRYFAYWMHPLCAFAAWPYREVALNRLGAFGAIAFHTRKYLNDVTGETSEWFPR
jgi:asparagine synthase (glutamine-hydrolysing)